MAKDTIGKLNAGSTHEVVKVSSATLMELDKELHKKQKSNERKKVKGEGDFVLPKIQCWEAREIVEDEKDFASVIIILMHYVYQFTKQDEDVLVHNRFPTLESTEERTKRLVELQKEQQSKKKTTRSGENREKEKE